MTVAVAGEAGIGKTAFLGRLALEAQLLGLRTASVRCPAAGGSPLAAVKALAAELSAASDGSFGSRLRRARREIAAGIPGPDDRVRKTIFLRSVLAAFASPTGPRPVLLIIDDVHIADSLTIEVLAGLARELAAERRKDAGDRRRLPSLAVAFRSESPFRPALTALREAIAAAGEAAEAIELGPLPAPAVEEWLDFALPDGSASVRERIAGGFGRNPFLVGEAIRSARRGETPGGARSIPSGRFLDGLPAADHDARCETPRSRFLRLHCAGLVDLLGGRHVAAIETFREAIPLGREVKDLHSVAFDLTYLGEAHLHRGELRAARSQSTRPSFGLGARSTNRYSPRSMRSTSNS